MNISDAKTRIRKGEYNDAFSMLYTDISTAAKRYIEALDEFEQGLSLAAAVTKNFLGKSGGCRVHGGFAGTIQCYISNDRLDAYCTMIEVIYG